MRIAGKMIGGIHPTLQRAGSVNFCGFLTPNDGVRNDRVVDGVRNDKGGGERGNDREEVRRTQWME